MSAFKSTIAPLAFCLTAAAFVTAWTDDPQASRPRSPGTSPGPSFYSEAALGWCQEKEAQGYDLLEMEADGDECAPVLGGYGFKDSKEEVEAEEEEGGREDVSPLAWLREV